MRWIPLRSILLRWVLLLILCLRNVTLSYVGLLGFVLLLSVLRLLAILRLRGVALLHNVERLRLRFSVTLLIAWLLMSILLLRVLPRWWLLCIGGPC